MPPKHRAERFPLNWVIAFVFEPHPADFCTCKSPAVMIFNLALPLGTVSTSTAPVRRSHTGSGTGSAGAPIPP